MTRNPARSAVPWPDILARQALRPGFNPPAISLRHLFPQLSLLRRDRSAVGQGQRVLSNAKGGVEQ